MASSVASIKIDISDKEAEIIRNCGRLGYKPEKMQFLLAYSLIEIESNFINPDSEFFTIYSEGKTLAEYEIDVALYQNAAKGDVVSIKELACRKRDRDASPI